MSLSGLPGPRPANILRAAAVLAVAMLAAAMTITPQAVAGEIHEAINRGDVNGVARLLAADPSLAEAPDEGSRFVDLPLHMAARNGQLEIIRLLLDAGADIDGFDIDESTPLHVAAVSRQPEAASLLLELGADVNLRDTNGGYSLSFAVSGGDTLIVRRMIEAGADLNYLSPQGVTLLHFAANRGLMGLFDLLMDRGSDVNAATERGEVPLHWAAGGGRTEMIEALIARGADPNVTADDGGTPLHSAAFRGRAEAARLLLALGADPNAAQEDGTTPLYGACWTGSADFAQAMIEGGAEVNCADDHRLTALHRAVADGNAEITGALLEAGARPDVAEDRYGVTPLHIAAACGFGDLAELLASAGAPVNVSDAAGHKPLDYAYRYANESAARVLESRGAEGTRLTGAATGRLAQQTDIGKGEAVIWYLGHSGWAVKTRKHFLVFDYFARDRRADEPGLANGWIDPAEIARENVTVFASHEHGDHLDPAIFEWKEDVRDITYIMGCTPAGEDLPPYELLGARESRKISGINITTIESNDTGVGFLVEVDGVSIYHAGDHANRQRDFSGPYSAEIDWLAERGARPDIAFMPISGCGFGDQEAVRLGVGYALEKLTPSVFFPMHAGRGEWRYREFIAANQADYPEIRMICPDLKGDRFYFSAGEIKLATR